MLVIQSQEFLSLLPVLQAAQPSQSKDDEKAKNQFIKELKNQADPDQSIRKAAREEETRAMQSLSPELKMFAFGPQFADMGIGFEMIGAEPGSDSPPANE